MMNGMMSNMMGRHALGDGADRPARRAPPRARIAALVKYLFFSR
jgi:hypothetical protein